MASLPTRKRSTKTSVECRSRQGTDVGLSSGDSNPLLGRLTTPSSVETMKVQQVPCCKQESKSSLPTRDVQIVANQLTLKLTEPRVEKGGLSRTSSPRTPRSKTDRGSGVDKGATLPPYIRATIAEQLAPLCTRRARENTQETLFGSAAHPPERRVVAWRSREDTQATLFGDTDPTTVRKSTRPVADTQNNLFGPPPEVRRRQGVRFQTDTPDILRHDDERRPNPSATADARYDNRHQDTHEKLFGFPTVQSCSQVQKPPLSNVFNSDSKTLLRDKIVRSLPMSSLIADE